MRQYLCLIFCLGCLTLCFPSCWAEGDNSPAEPIVLRYPGPDSIGVADNRNRYFIELLARVLEAAGGHYRAAESGRGLTTTRQFQLIAQGKLDITWNFSDPDRDQTVRQIRFPIDRGLMGWRLLLIHNNQQQQLQQIHTLAELKPFSLAQGQAWQDTFILKANGLPVVATSSYEGIFKMLQADHIAYFPRSILEINDEIKNHPQFDLAIDPHLMLYYPTAYYFYVNKNNLALARELELGLKRLFESGEFERFFMQYNGEFIRQAHVEQRQIIRLNNPYFSAANLNNLHQYWLPLPAQSSATKQSRTAKQRDAAK